MKPFRMLEGRRAVVTGGAQGMGRAVSLLLAAQGATVMFTDIDDTLANLTLTDLQRLAPDCRYHHVDMGDPVAVSAFTVDAVRHLGHVDILVNLVGINQRQYAVDMDMAVFNRLLDVNLKSTLRLAKAFVPGMAAAGGGSIVNISSVHATATMSGFSAYASTKGGLEAFTRVMAIDCAPQNIRVNAIAPGAVYTSEMRPYWEGATGEEIDMGMLLGHQPLFGPGLSPNAANAVLFLVSDMASYITGATLRLDGATSLQAHRVERFLDPPDYDELVEGFRVKLDKTKGGGP